jgi:hypothetical protein
MGASIRLVSIDCVLSLAKIYNKVDWPPAEDVKAL